MLGFKGLGWFLCGVIVAPVCYLVTSTGATERARLASVEAKIVEARKQIRDLETDYQARANMIQLEQWNGEALQLAAPAAGQYLASDTELAGLDAREAQPQLQMASAAVVPAGPRAAVAVAQPAVLTRDGPLKSERLPAVASADGAAKARTVAVAMLDRKLLSPAMEDELKRLADAERQKLR